MWGVVVTGNQREKGVCGRGRNEVGGWGRREREAEAMKERPHAHWRWLQLNENTNKQERETGRKTQKGHPCEEGGGEAKGRGLM